MSTVGKQVESIEPDNFIGLLTPEIKQFVAAYPAPEVRLDAALKIAEAVTRQKALPVFTHPSHAFLTFHWSDPTFELTSRGSYLFRIQRALPQHVGQRIVLCDPGNVDALEAGPRKPLSQDINLTHGLLADNQIVHSFRANLMGENHYRYVPPPYLAMRSTVQLEYAHSMGISEDGIFTEGRKVKAPSDVVLYEGVISLDPDHYSGPHHFEPRAVVVGNQTVACFMNMFDERRAMSES
jgi:hypothetical protein